MLRVGAVLIWRRVEWLQWSGETRRNDWAGLGTGQTDAGQHEKGWKFCSGRNDALCCALLCFAVARQSGKGRASQNRSSEDPGGTAGEREVWRVNGARLLRGKLGELGTLEEGEEEGDGPALFSSF